MSESFQPHRRGFLIGAAALAGSSCDDAAHIKLKPEGAERALPSHMLGFNTPANYAVPFESPSFTKVVQELGPHLVRFPGGTVANYYNWRTGQLDVAEIPNGSIYRKFLVERAVPNSRRLHPSGVFWEDFRAFAGEVGSEVIMLPNLESSTIESETERFAEMARRGGVPRRIELGNEFYLAALMDPLTLSIFPDYASTMTRTRRYLDAIGPYLRNDAVVAVQAAAPLLHARNDTQHTQNARELREREWNNALKPEPWFDAVVAHLYVTMSRSAGSALMNDIAGNAGKIYPAMLANADEGIERALADIAARTPGKEIWVTEWGGFEPQLTFANADIEFDGMWLHQIIRTLLAQLRRPEVTVSTYHALFARGGLTSCFRLDSSTNSYIPINATGVMQWFFHASRGPDSHYQRITAEGSARITADGVVEGEGFQDIEAAMFRVGRRYTLFIHNAWDEARRIDLSDIVDESTPLEADVVQTPDLLKSLQQAAPEPCGLEVGSGQVVAPRYSFLRVHWER